MTHRILSKREQARGLLAIIINFTSFTWIDAHLSLIKTSWRWIITCSSNLQGSKLVNMLNYSNVIPVSLKNLINACVMIMYFSWWTSYSVFIVLWITAIFNGIKCINVRRRKVEHRDSKLHWNKERCLPETKRTVKTLETFVRKKRN